MVLYTHYEKAKLALNRSAKIAAREEKKRTARKVALGG